MTDTGAAKEPVEKRAARKTSSSKSEREEAPSHDRPNRRPSGWEAVLNPIVLIAVMILGGVLFLIFAAIMGFDRGVLQGMAETKFARGLITYLFAVVTIGTAVVLVVYSLTSTTSGVEERQFDRGKDVLSLLLGVFGTIVGFYFGTEVSNPRASAELSVTPAYLTSLQVQSGETLPVTAHVSGGTGPYLYSVVLGGESPEPNLDVDFGGWIVSELSAPIVTEATSIPLTIKVRDAEGREQTTSRSLRVVP